MPEVTAMGFSESHTLQAVDHPAAREDTEVVSVDEFYSMWRSRTVDCPWGSGRPAVETLLLHHEQFKIPENLVCRVWGRRLGQAQTQFGCRCAPAQVGSPMTEE